MVSCVQYFTLQPPVKSCLQWQIILTHPLPQGIQVFAVCGFCPSDFIGEMCLEPVSSHKTSSQSSQVIAQPGNRTRQFENKEDTHAHSRQQHPQQF
jgi:hypothetical protein